MGLAACDRLDATADALKRGVAGPGQFVDGVLPHTIQ